MNNSDVEITQKTIITFNSTSKSYVINELRDILKTELIIEDVDDGIMIIKGSLKFREISNTFKSNPSIFIRHICPADIVINANKSADDTKSLINICPDLIVLLKKNKTFSVQTRIVQQNKKPSYGNFDINEAVSKNLINSGFELNVREPEQVVSILCTAEKIYLGVSDVNDNLSNWAGGTRRFAREDGQLSRSEFKLLEAIEVFNLKIPTEGKALDLGAAPGGWTRVLVNKGLRVVSVDPAFLDERIEKNPVVTHYKGRAQDYFDTHKEKFDIIVNDMRMDVKESAEIMNVAKDYLRTHGFAIMTLKLTATGMQRTVKNAIKELEKSYDIIGARQLFHNRNEVTIALKNY